MNKILVIDDDEALCDLLRDYLKLEGFAVDAIHDGGEAIAHCREHSYDALILDIMLPTTQGLDVLRELRQFSQVPIIMLTARGADTDRIVGLEMGADDYLPKPCNPRELTARLRAVLRRSDTRANDGTDTSLQSGSLTLDKRNRTAVHKGEALSLTGAEFNILAVLMQHQQTIVSKNTLCQNALGRPLSAYDRSVDVHVSKLRKKLVDACAQAQIVNVRGAGYQLIPSAAGGSHEAAQ